MTTITSILTAHIAKAINENVKIINNATRELRFHTTDSPERSSIIHTKKLAENDLHSLQELQTLLTQRSATTALHRRTAQGAQLHNYYTLLLDIVISEIEKDIVTTYVREIAE